MRSAVQDLGLDAEDAEDEGQGAAGEVEKNLPGIHDAMREVVDVAGDAEQLDGGLHGGKEVGVQGGEFTHIAEAADEAEEDGKAEDAGDGLVAGDRTGEDADGDKEQAADRDEQVAADQRTGV